MFKNPVRAFTGNAPTVRDISLSYGENVAKSWLATQLWDLSEFGGCRDKITERQIDQTCDMVMNNPMYASWKVSEFLYFFAWAKMNVKFYGSIDPMIILEYLRKFQNVRAEKLDEIENERKAQEREEWEKVAITREEYERRKGNANG